MKKVYSKPDIEVLKLSSIAEDFLSDSYEPNENPNGMGGSSATIKPGKEPTIY